jgi:hypothetical protein
MERGQELILRETDVTLRAADRRRGVLALEARHLGGGLG